MPYRLMTTPQGSVDVRSGDVDPHLPVVQVKRLSPNARLPGAALRGDAGADLKALEPLWLQHGGGRELVRTGLAVAVPEGHVGLVVPRSGLAAKHGITVLNAPGVIDSGYRGELLVPLVNTDPHDDYQVRPGDRVAQLLVLPALLPSGNTFEEVSCFDATQRGAGGFGHTGT